MDKVISYNGRTWIIPNAVSWELENWLKRNAVDANKVQQVREVTNDKGADSSNSLICE